MDEICPKNLNVVVDGYINVLKKPKKWSHTPFFILFLGYIINKPMTSSFKRPILINSWFLGGSPTWGLVESWRFPPHPQHWGPRHRPRVSPTGSCRRRSPHPRRMSVSSSGASQVPRVIQGGYKKIYRYGLGDCLTIVITCYNMF